jgi:tripartite-type tricarboxylate transporter receptor subunit TctC
MSRIKSHRWLLAAAVALSGLGSAATQGWAQAWPAKPIRLIVPLTAGSATDVMARLVMDQVSVQLEQPIVLENRPGAGATRSA